MTFLNGIAKLFATKEVEKRLNHMEFASALLPKKVLDAIDTIHLMEDQNPELTTRYIEDLTDLKAQAEHDAMIAEVANTYEITVEEITAEMRQQNKEFFG